MKKLSYADFIGFLISLICLAILLPSEAYHGPKIVIAAYTSLLILLVALFALSNLFKATSETNDNSFSPVLSIACIFSAVFSGIGFHLNIQDDNQAREVGYKPNYQGYVRDIDCHEKKNSRRSLIPNLCTFNIQSIDSGIGSIIREFSAKQSELDCIRFDIQKGKLGLNYAYNIISCDDLKNKKRLQKYRQGFDYNKS